MHGTEDDDRCVGCGRGGWSSTAAAYAAGGTLLLGAAVSTRQLTYQGYYDSHKDAYLVTDVSSKTQATALHVNSSAALAAVSGAPAQYFIKGRAAAGQLAVFGSEPGEKDYNPLWEERFVTWKPGVTPVLLTRIALMLGREMSGEPLPSRWPSETRSVYIGLKSYEIVGASTCAAAIVGALEALAEADDERELLADLREAGAAFRALKPSTAAYANVVDWLLRDTEELPAAEIRTTVARRARAFAAYRSFCRTAIA